jgi:Flp pilus assembly pilin Flp
MHGQSARAIQPEGILFMMDRFNVWVGSIVARSHDIRNDDGQTFVEYALVLSVIVVALLAAFTLTDLGAAIGTALGKITAAVSGP